MQYNACLARSEETGTPSRSFFMSTLLLVSLRRAVCFLQLGEYKYYRMAFCTHLYSNNHTCNANDHVILQRSLHSLTVLCVFQWFNRNCYDVRPIPSTVSTGTTMSRVHADAAIISIRAPLHLKPCSEHLRSARTKHPIKAKIQPSWLLQQYWHVPRRTATTTELHLRKHEKMNAPPNTLVRISLFLGDMSYLDCFRAEREQDNCSRTQPCR